MIWLGSDDSVPIRPANQRVVNHRRRAQNCYASHAQIKITLQRHLKPQTDDELRQKYKLLRSALQASSMNSRKITTEVVHSIIQTFSYHSSTYLFGTPQEMLYM
jgi:hypothetical protein